MMSRLKKCKKISATLLLLFLVACGGDGTIRDEVVRPVLVTEWVDLGGYIRATYVKINGIQCIVATEQASGGNVSVSCDWNDQ